MDRPITEDEEFLHEMREALMRLRREIVAKNREKIGEMAADDPVGGGDSIDKTVTQQTKDADLRLHGRFAEMLKLVEEAEHRIEDGEYGECIECGEEISRGRLRSKPEAPRCVDCQSELETEAKRRYKRPGLIDEYE